MIADEKAATSENEAAYKSLKNLMNQEAECRQVKNCLEI
jgi:hypothetical protein